VGNTLTEARNGFSTSPSQRTRGVHDAWASIANAAGCCTFLLTSDGVYRTGAKTTAAALNITAESMVGRSVNDFFPPELALTFRHWVRETLDADARGEHEPQHCNMLLFGRVWSMYLAATDDWETHDRIVIVAANPSAEPVDLTFILDQVRHARDRKMILGDIAKLSEAEIEVFALVGSGIRDIDVAKALGRSVRTVNGNVRRIMQKLGLERRTQMVKLAHDIGLVAKAARAAA
jgi:DNA-binding CsgD family transcriptional regulator